MNQLITWSLITIQCQATGAHIDTVLSSFRRAFPHDGNGDGADLESQRDDSVPPSLAHPNDEFDQIYQDLLSGGDAFAVRHPFMVQEGPLQYHFGPPSSSRNGDCIIGVIQHGNAGQEGHRILRLTAVQCSPSCPAVIHVTSRKKGTERDIVWTTWTPQNTLTIVRPVGFEEIRERLHVKTNRLDAVAITEFEVHSHHICGREMSFKIHVECRRLEFRYHSFKLMGWIRSLDGHQLLGTIPDKGRFYIQGRRGQSGSTHLIVILPRGGLFGGMEIQLGPKSILAMYPVD